MCLWMQNEGIRLFEAKYLASFRHLIGKYDLSAVQGELQRKLHGTAVNLLKHERLSSDFMDDIQDIFLAGMRKWEEQGDIPIQHKCNQIVLNLMAKKLLDLPPAEEMKDVYKAFDDFVGAVFSLPLNIPGTTYARGIQAEHDALLKAKGKGNEKLTWNDYQSMKFVHCVINETLRLSSATVVLFREAKQDIKVK
ncbi:hypothetical protein KI387_016005, partial [Taxus chinensis]